MKTGGLPSQRGAVGLWLCVALMAPLAAADADIARFNECYQQAKKGQATGELCLLEMLSDESSPSGIRGLAALGLGRIKSPRGHASLRTAAEGLLESPSMFGTKSERKGVASSLVEALSEYQAKEDLPLVLRLAEVSGASGSALALSVYGDASAQPILRAALQREQNAGSVLRLNLALSRCGAVEGSDFVRRVLLNSVSAPLSAGQQIDMQEENPLSGRLARDLEADLGGVPADRQFLPDLLWILEQYPCENCLGPWGPIARIGTAGVEERIIAIVVEKKAMYTVALQALIYNGALKQARHLAALVSRAAEAEGLIKHHESGKDATWFRGRSRVVD